MHFSKKPFSLILIIICINTVYLQAQFTNVMIDNNFYPEEPSITINPLNTNIIAGGSNINNAYHSTDGGATWITDFISSSFTDAGDPCLTADSSGNIFYFHLVNPVDKIVCQKSSDGGANYSNGSFAWNNNSLFQDKEWGVADMHNGNLYVTWTQYDNGNNPGPNDSSSVYFSRSTDNGLTFSDGIRLNEHAGDCLYLDITDPHPFVGINGEVYVTFMDSDGIRFNRSLDTGITWMSSQPLIESGGQYRYNSVFGVTRLRAMPYNAVDHSNSNYRGNLYVSWADQRNGINNSDIFIIKSSDGGNTWSSALKVNTDNSGRQQYRNAMAVDQTNGYIYIVYYDRRNYVNNDSVDVYVSRSTDGGDNWTDFKVSNAGFYSDGSTFDGDYIDIAAHAGRIRPIWTSIDAFGCNIWTCLFDESQSGIASNDAKSNFNFTVNPNPAKIVSEISFFEKVKDVDVSILDFSGRLITSFKVQNESEKTIDLRNVPAGIYFVKAGNITKKIVVLK